MAKPSPIQLLRSSGSVLLGFVIFLSLLIGNVTAIQHFFPESVPTELNTQTGPGMLLIFLALALLQATIAGYVTATAAKRREFLHGAALAIIFLMMGVASLMGETTQPIWYNIGFLIATVGGVFAGVEFRLAHKASRQEDADGGEPRSWHPAFRGKDTE